MKTRTMILSAVAGAMFAIGAGALAMQDEPSRPKKEEEAPKRAEIGKKAPDFELKDLEGKTHKLSDYKGKTIILEWFNPECPWVVHVHKEDHAYKKWSNSIHEEKDYVIFAINSGAPGTQGSGLEKNKDYQKRWKIKYPILLDEEGKVGRLYDARTSPHMYVIDKEFKLRYAGAIDNYPAGRVAENEEPVNYVMRAIEQIKKGTEVSPEKTRPYGCSVKYARGSEPSRQREPREPRRPRGRGPGGGGRGGE